VGGFPLALSTNTNIISIVSSLVFYKRSLDYLDTYRDKVKAITAQQIMNAFHQQVKPNVLVTVTVGPNQNKKIN